MEENLEVDFIEAFKNRTKQFVIANIKLFQNFPKSEEARIIGQQIIKKLFISWCKL